MQSSLSFTQQEAAEGTHTNMFNTLTLVRGINSMGNQLVYHKGDLRPRAAIFMKGVQGNVVPVSLLGT